MNETTKTGIFAGVAGVLALATWVTLPGSVTKSTKTSIGPASGESLFKDYDPLTATSLKIVRYNKELAEVSDFEVAKDKGTGVWTIPSHAGYPADAEKQMSETANMFNGLKILDKVTEKRDEHALFGVVEPDPEKVQAGDEGVGTLIRIQDSKGDMLANLVVGATEKDNPKHRFVRVPSQDIVYIVELDTAPISTEFTRWIEPDLLKLSSTDIQTLGIRDYAILQTNQGAVLNPNFDADVSFTTTDGKWNADSIRLREGAESKPRLLTEEEQLNATKLNEMRNALDSLRIVDVRRKPKGLAANLKMENALLNDRESLIAMARKGFIPQKGEDGSSEIFAANGELLATLKDGVQYIVRFGNTTGESSETENAEKKEGEPASDKDSSIKLDRYMLVTTKVDETQFPPVVLKAIPETYEDLVKMEAAASPEATQVPSTVVPAPGETPVTPKEEPPSPPDTPAESNKNPEGEKKEEPKQEVEPKSAQSNATQSNAKRSQDRLVSFQGNQEGTQEKVAAPVQDKPTEDKPVEAKPADAKADQPLSDDEKKERLEAARERITKENQRMIDDRNDRLDKARKRVGELNARFSDWFYVIGDSEYKRLRIKLDELIQPKSAGNPGPGGPGMPGGFPGSFNPGALNLPGQ